MEPRLAWRISYACQGRGGAGDAVFPGQALRQNTSRIEAALPQAFGVEWDGNNGVGETSTNLGGSFEDHVLAKSIGTGVESPKAGRRVLEGVNESRCRLRKGNGVDRPAR
jgi:hypothetical protein